MKKAAGIAAIALLLSGGGTAALAAGEMAADQTDKGQQSQPSSPSFDPNKREMGGPRGDAEVGIPQPTKPVPDNPAPGYEGADKDKSGKSSTHGGPR